MKRHLEPVALNDCASLSRSGTGAVNGWSHDIQEAVFFLLFAFLIDVGNDN